MLTLADIIPLFILTIWFVLHSMHSAGTIISYCLYIIYNDSKLVLTFRSQYNKYFINNYFVYEVHQKNLTVTPLSQKMR